MGATVLGDVPAGETWVGSPARSMRPAQQAGSEKDIPLVDLSLQRDEIAAEVADGFERVLAAGSYILGPDVALFERDYGAFSAAAHCVGVGNGTDALEFALRAVGVQPGGEVILPANTFVATAGAVMRAGAVPVPVDCDENYLLIDPAKIEERITDRTQAIVPVDLYGQMAPMTEVLEIARRHGLRVVEDAAQSQGAEQNGQRAGSVGDATATSFYPGKNLGAYGDGGAALTNAADVAERLRRLRNHGGTAKYQHPELGFNSRLDTLQAVVLRAKLSRLDKWNEQRREAATRYDELLVDLPGVATPRTAPGNRHVWHLYVVQVDERDRVLAELNAAGIGAGIHYPVPIHLHGAYAHLGHGPGDFPVAEAAARRILSLPIYPEITAYQQERVAAALRAAVS
jgi:dTDP-4-amino-4,6-dideoxygalactose transaminase